MSQPRWMDPWERRVCAAWVRNGKYTAMPDAWGEHDGKRNGRGAITNAAEHRRHIPVRSTLGVSTRRGRGGWQRELRFAAHRRRRLCGQQRNRLAQSAANRVVDESAGDVDEEPRKAKSDMFYACVCRQRPKVWLRFSGTVFSRPEANPGKRAPLSRQKGTTQGGPSRAGC